MFFLLLFLTAWLVALFGWGVVFERLLGLSPSPWPPEDRTAFRILLGHVPVVTFGYLVHLVTPLAGWPGMFVLAFGWAVTLSLVRRVRPDGRTFALFALVTIFVSAFCARLMIHGDSGGYHTQAILWMAEEPVIRGLANLTSVFGYNTPWWMLAGLMSWPTGVPHGATCVSAPIMVATGVLLLAAVLRLLRKEGSLADWFWIPAIYLWLRQVVGVNTPSPTTDVPANLLILAALWLVVRSGRQSPLTLINAPEGRWFLALALLAATIKLSASPLLAAGLVWLAVAWLGLLVQKTPASLSLIGRSFLCLLPLAVCGLAFLYHGWLLSGYPLFPSTLGGTITAPWQVPAWLADHTVERTREWAITFGASAEQMRSTPAWKIWLEGQNGVTNVAIALVAGISTCVGAIFLLRDRAHLAPRLRILWLPALIALLGFAWNFSQVPALRFASGFVFALLGCGFALVGPQLPALLARGSVVGWTLLCAAALSKLALSRPISFVTPPAPQPPDNPTERVTKEGYVVRISGYSWFAPKPAMVSYEFDENLTVLRSPDGKQILEFRGAKDFDAVTAKP